MAIPGAPHHSFSALSNLSYLAPIPYYHHTRQSPMVAAQEDSASLPQAEALPPLSQRRQRQPPMVRAGTKRKQPADAGIGSGGHQKQLDGVASQTASPTPQQQPQPAATTMDALPKAKAPRSDAAGTAPPPSLQRYTSQSSKLLDATVAARNFVAKTKAVQSKPPTESSLPSTKELPKGVTMRPSGNWQAQVYFCGQSRYIGVFDNAEDAALAYTLVKEGLGAYQGGRKNGRPKLDKDQANKVLEEARRLAEEAISERRKQSQEE